MAFPGGPELEGGRVTAVDRVLVGLARALQGVGQSCLSGVIWPFRVSEAPTEISSSIPWSPRAPFPRSARPVLGPDSRPSGLGALTRAASPGGPASFVSG